MAGFVVLERSLIRGGVPFVDRALAELQRRDERWLRDHPRAPRLYSSGVRYVANGARTELWRTVPEVLVLSRSTGGTDCQDLAAWRAAELVVRGQDPAARAVSRLYVLDEPSGDSTMLFHAVVRRGDGSVEDPSAALGMRL